MKKKLPKTTEFTPIEIAKNQFLMNSYEDIIRAAKRNVPVKDVKYVREDLKAQMCKFTRIELIDFDRQVKEHLEVLERRSEIQRLRNSISNKEIKLQQLLNEQEKKDN